MITAQDGTLAATLYPTGFVVESPAGSTNDWSQFGFSHVILHRIGTNGAVQTELVCLIDVRIRNLDEG